MPVGSYLLLKTLHILGVVVFLGNVVVSGVWKTLADRTRDPRVIAYAQRLIVVTDLAFTTTGVLLILVTGLRMAPGYGGVTGPGWLSWGLGLLAASGVIWLLILLPVQVAQLRMVRGWGPDAVIPERYWRLGRIWMVFGTIATVLPLITLYLMVFKPR